MKHTMSFALMATALAVMMLVGCGGSPTVESATADEAAPAQPKTPADLGNAAADLYGQAMSELVTLLKDKPAPADVKDKVAQLKEQYVQKLLALGRQREALSASDRATADMRVSLGLERAAGSSFQEYSTLQNYYMGQDNELANQIASFNILTQYFNFDLLKKQVPAEARRLGIQ